MTTTPKSQDLQTPPTETKEPGSLLSTTNWEDANGRSWSIEFFSQRITLTHRDEIFEITQPFWKRDIYVAVHGEGYIIRFDTPSCSIGFIIEHEHAHPLLSHIGHTADATVDLDVEVEENASKSVEPLLWPKVSPLAVWALLSSSLVFIPFFGLIPAMATTVLLISHRARVKPTHANRHSRILCTAAFVFLVTGLMVSALGSWSLYTHAQPDPVSVSVIEPPLDAHAQTQQNATSTRVQEASILDKDHNWGLIIAALFVVLLSLTVHEAAHAVTAWWMGDDFAKRLGRVTLNPSSHIDPFGTILLPLILFMSGVGVFGWAKPVPVRLDYVSRPRRAHILISMAGPCSNLLMAAASLSLMIGIGCVISMIAPNAVITHYDDFSFTETVTFSGIAAAPLLGPLCTILKLSFIVNIFLAFFNLIPIPPLDGSWVVENLFPKSLGPIYYRIRPYAFILFLILIYTGILYYLLLPAIFVIYSGLSLLGQCTFG